MRFNIILFLQNSELLISADWFRLSNAYDGGVDGVLREGDYAELA